MTRIIIVDDYITRPDIKEWVDDVLDEAGLSPNEVSVILDREDGTALCVVLARDDDGRPIVKDGEIVWRDVEITT
jgi:hypothetical protein